VTAEPILVVARLARVLDDLGIPYLVGGSFASSVYGTPRATQDVDIVADIAMTHVDPLARALGVSFHVDRDMMREAVREQGTFNVLYLPTMFKADVFVLKGDPRSREELKRARTEEIETSEGKVHIRFATPEDTLLHKLYWYRLGNETSDRQWSDVTGMLKVQADSLDYAYLDRWAQQLGVSDLLAKAKKGLR
jgi:hypothetical protein